MTTRSREELEKEAYRVLSSMWEFPIIQKAIQEANGDINNAIDAICVEGNAFCLYGGTSSRGNFDHEISLLKGGYIKIWEPENDNIMERKPDLVLNMHQIFHLIKHGPTKQMGLF